MTCETVRMLFEMARSDTRPPTLAEMFAVRKHLSQCRPCVEFAVALGNARGVNWDAAQQHYERHYAPQIANDPETQDEAEKKP